MSIRKTESGWVASIEEVKNVAWEHFAKKFTEEESVRPTLEGVEFNFLSIEYNDSLLDLSLWKKSERLFVFVMVARARALMGSTLNF